MENIKLFKNLTNEFLTSCSSIKYEWGERDNGNIICVSITKQNENGFNVWWGYDGNDILYSAGDVHHSELYFDQKTSWETQMKNHLGFLRDLLSKKMRIVEKYAGKTPYKVLIQAWDGKQWQTEDIFGLLLFNYLGKRSEKIFQNNIIEGYEIKNST